MTANPRGGKDYRGDGTPQKAAGVPDADAREDLDRVIRDLAPEAESGGASESREGTGGAG